MDMTLAVLGAKCEPTIHCLNYAPAICSPPGRKLRVTVRAEIPQILRTVVLVVATDVIKDQR